MGIAVVGPTESWTDWQTGHRERRACLVPLAKFTHPVPMATAKSKGRLRGPSVSEPRQRPNRQGGVGFTLSYVEWKDADALDLLSLCGIPPEALDETDVAVLGARLRSTATGRPLYRRLRYDAILKDRARRVHERRAVAQARSWAASKGWAEYGDFQLKANAGFDLLFCDARGNKIEVEVKGYAATDLARVRLQPSQVRRAREAAEGKGNDWVHCAVLRVNTATPQVLVLHAPEVVSKLARGELRARSF